MESCRAQVKFVFENTVIEGQSSLRSFFPKLPPDVNGCNKGRGQNKMEFPSDLLHGDWSSM